MTKDIPVEKSKDGTISTENPSYQIVPAGIIGMEPVKNAVMALSDGIVKRFNSPDYVTLAMHVNVNTAKADLIPVPHPSNIMKLQDHFPNLPKKVQEVIKKN